MNKTWIIILYRHINIGAKQKLIIFDQIVYLHYSLLNGTIILKLYKLYIHVKCNFKKHYMYSNFFFLGSCI